jgi:curved DNA-binding protein CbpA
MPEDFYDLLGLSPDATQEDVKRAFREKVREYHPDLNDDPRAQAQFTALKTAYETLEDPNEREAYDRMGHEDYVAKRTSGLPSQDKWATGDSSSTPTATATTRGGSSTTSSTSTESSSGKATASTAAAGATAGAATGTSAGGTATASATSESASSRSVSDTSGPTGSVGGTARRRSRRRSTESAGTLAQLWRIGFGWPLILATDVLYVVGIELFVGANLTGVLEALRVGREAGTDVDALRSLLLGPGFDVAAFVTEHNYVEGSPVPVGGAILVLGALLLPLVYGVVIQRTRRSFSAWNPTRLYVAAALAPIAGLVLSAAGYDRLGIDVVCFGVLPLAAIVLLPSSAFVRPWILHQIRR